MPSRFFLNLFCKFFMSLFTPLGCWVISTSLIWASVRRSINPTLIINSVVNGIINHSCSIHTRNWQPRPLPLLHHRQHRPLWCPPTALATPDALPPCPDYITLHSPAYPVGNLLHRAINYPGWLTHTHVDRKGGLAGQSSLSPAAPPGPGIGSSQYARNNGSGGLVVLVGSFSYHQHIHWRPISHKTQFRATVSRPA